MKQLVVDIADIKVSNDPDSVIITYALGSCIAVMVHDPKRMVGGMLHYMLPFAKTAPAKAQQKPAMFADTGLPVLFEKIFALGARKENLVIKVAGGGHLFDDKGTFDIGRRNHVVLRKYCWDNSFLVAAEDVGGAKSRSTKLFIRDGRVVVRSQGQENDL